jgi:uncharacterized protein YdiU (UPF0061 family)
MARFADLPFHNHFAGLGEAFAERILPTPLPNPYLVAFNPDGASLIGLDRDASRDQDFVEYAAGNRVAPGVEPVAMVYAGHQFGVFVPRLGDGRAILIGDLTDAQGGRWELQLKGAGQTRYSRFGDGRAVLRSTIREYLGSEALAGLGIPTTRALSIAGSDLPVQREELETAAVLIRLAPTHVRFGSFEYFAARGQAGEVRRLAEWVITDFHPELAGRDDRYSRWFQEIVDRTARLVAAWMAAGWAHGVLNTDNMSILGWTIDYGPFGFLDAYDPGFICNHSDHEGRYAYNRQPGIGLWNLTRLAEALLSLVSEPDLVTALNTYQPTFETEYARLMRLKLGLEEHREHDRSLVWALLQVLQAGKVDYTRFFRLLAAFDSTPGAETQALREECGFLHQYDEWALKYAERLRAEGSVDAERSVRMRGVNPAYVLRNWLAERAIRMARDDRDFTEIERLRRLLHNPFEEQAGMEEYAAAPPDWGRHLVVSCSS